jgi:hypothetical protein
MDNELVDATITRGAAMSYDEIVEYALTEFDTTLASVTSPRRATARDR